MCVYVCGPYTVQFVQSSDECLQCSKQKLQLCKSSISHLGSMKTYFGNRFLGLHLALICVQTNFYWEHQFNLSAIMTTGDGSGVKPAPSDT